MSQYGFIPKEGNFGYLGVEKMIQRDKKEKCLILGLTSDVSASTQATSVGLRDDSDAVETIPQGSKIQSVQIRCVDATLIDDSVEFCLGYFSTAVSGDVETSLLSQRILDESTKLTGDVLKAYKSITICDSLEGDKIALMNKVLQKVSAPVPKKGAVPEPVDLVPNVTLLKGTLPAGSIEFVFHYCF